MNLPPERGRKDFPPPLDWSARAGAAPYLPGGPKGIIENLAALLGDIADNPLLDRSVLLPAVGTSVPLRKIASALGTCGLFTRESRPARLNLTEDARYFLESADELYLFAVLHANVRFMGEVLAHVGGGITHEQLQEIAASQYALHWASLDQVRRRVYWLRATGLVEFWTNNKIVSTPRGRKLLEQLELVDPDALPHRRIEPPGRVELPAPPAPLAARLAETDQAALLSRKRPMGYVAGGWQVEVLGRVVNAAMPEITREDFLRFCVEQFHVAASSAEQALGPLRTLEILEQIGPDTFAATEIAAACLASGEPLDFIRLLHLNVAMLGETLDALDSGVHSRDVPKIFTERYPGLRIQFSREDITTRLALLHEAGLVERIGLTIQRTPLGTAFLYTLPLLKREGDGTEQAASSEDARSLPESAIRDNASAAGPLAAEVVRASTDSAEPRRFERAVAAAFCFLGVEVEPHGGPKRTDLIVGLWKSPTSLIRVAVEVKTDGAGLVTDQDVKFLRLAEHRQIHRAHGTVLIGPQFDARVEHEAAREGVAVLTAQALGRAVLRHARAPLAPSEVAALVTAGGADALERTWAVAERRQEALGHVLHAVWKSGNDPVDVAFTSGALGITDIWRETKGMLETPLSQAEIEEALVFLGAPIIAGVAKQGSEYVATAPPPLVAARLRALASAIESTVCGDGGRASAPNHPPLPAPRPRQAQGLEAPDAVDPAAVRAWAQAQGRTVNSRGRLPASVIRDYRRAGNLDSEQVPLFVE